MQVPTIRSNILGSTYTRYERHLAGDKSQDAVNYRGDVACRRLAPVSPRLSSFVCRAAYDTDCHHILYTPIGHSVQ